MKRSGSLFPWAALTVGIAFGGCRGAQTDARVGSVASRADTPELDSARLLQTASSAEDSKQPAVRASADAVQPSTSDSKLASASLIGAPQARASDVAASADKVQQPVPSEQDVLASLPVGSASTSVGSPTNGRLQGGVALPLTALGLRYNERREESARFATAEVVRAIVRAARTVHDALPGSELVVNDLSFEAGGPIPHHGSHRAGRDADILFYLLGDDGQPIRSVGAPLDPEGIGFDYKDLSVPDDDVRVHFDAARTWRFVQALLEDAEAPVQRIFVVEHLREKLLAEAKRVGAPEGTVARFADVTCQPSYPHDDHLHVRWYCSEEDLGQGCEDLPPLYPWRAQQLADAGVKPVQARMTRSREPAPIVTHEQAERAVRKSKPHPSVLAFLVRRKAWQKQPHPGRPYCR